MYRVDLVPHVMCYAVTVATFLCSLGILDGQAVRISTCARMRKSVSSSGVDGRLYCGRQAQKVPLLMEVLYLEDPGQAGDVGQSPGQPCPSSTLSLMQSQSHLKHEANY